MEWREERKLAPQCEVDLFSWMGIKVALQNEVQGATPGHPLCAANSKYFYVSMSVFLNSQVITFIPHDLHYKFISFCSLVLYYLFFIVLYNGDFELFNNTLK